MQSRTITITNSELKRKHDLMYYVITNNLDKIKQLNLVSTINVDNCIDTINGSTALQYSIQHSDNLITNYLLELGADPYKKNSLGKNSFQLSLDYHKICIFDYIIKKKDDDIKQINEDCIQLKKKLKVETESKDYLTNSIDNYRKNINNLQNDIKIINGKNEKLETINNELKEENRILKRKNDKLNESVNQFLNLNKK
jgi:ankyrin repeat protein